MSRVTDASEPTSDADVELLRERLGTLALAMAGFAFMAFGAVISFWFAHLRPLYTLGATLASSAGWLGSGVVLPLLSWVAVRRVQQQRWLEVIDVAMVVGFCWSLNLALSVAAPSTRPDLGAVLVDTFALVVRAAWLPSSPRRTAIVSTVAALPTLYVSWVAFAYPHPSIPPPSPAVVASFAGVWLFFTIAAATLTASVVYGLRREVRSARRLGAYTLERKIGEGGMGEVYRARHALLRRPTAIKLIARAAEGDTAARRFEREVQLTSQLSHPNTIAIYDYGRTHDGIFYYAMEYLDGLDLRRLVAGHGPQPAARAIFLLRQVCAALAEAHELGIVHRDIKPANVFLCTRGGQHDVVKVLDFGLVKYAVDALHEGVSQTGAIVGTPAYLSPEAIRGEAVDARSDLYALGAVGYFLLTGTEMFSGKTLVEVASKHLYAAPEPLAHRSEVPHDLAAVVMQCVAKSPPERFADARALDAALARCADAGRWGEEEARAWWSEHAASARRPSTPEPSMTDLKRLELTVTRHG